MNINGSLMSMDGADDPFVRSLLVLLTKEHIAELKFVAFADKGDHARVELDITFGICGRVSNVRWKFFTNSFWQLGRDNYKRGDRLPTELHAEVINAIQDILL